MSDPYAFLEEAEKKGHLRPDQVEQFKIIKKRRAFKSLMKMKDEGKLSDEQSAMLGQIDPQKFAGSTTRGGAIARGAVDEASLGFADEVGGFVRGALTDTDIPAATNQIRASSAIAEENRPGSYLGGQIAGGVGSALIPGSAALRIARAGGGIGKRIGASAAAGAATEGVRGFGHAQDVGNDYRALQEQFLNRMRGAAGAAPAGGLIGAAAPVVGRGVEKVAGKIGRAVAGSKIPGAGRRTAEELLDVVLRDKAATGRNLTADAAKPGAGQSDAVLPSLRRMGNESTLADAGGDYQLLAAEAARVAGPENPALARVMTDRAAGAPTRISNELDKNIAPTGTAAKMADRLDARRRTISQQYDEVLGNSGPVDASGLASSIARDANFAGPKIMPILRKYHGALTERGDAVPAKTLHNIRSDFASEIQQMQSRGDNAQAAALSRLLPRFDAALDDVPGYRQVRESYGKELGTRDAIEAGRGAFRGTNRPSSQEFAAQHAARSPDEQRHFRYGMREALDRSAGTNKRGQQGLAALMEQRFNRDTLTGALPPKASRNILDRLGTESTFEGTNKAIASATKSGNRAHFASGLAESNKGTPSMPMQMGVSLLNRLIDASKLSPRRRSLNDVAGRYDSRSDFRLGRVDDRTTAAAENAIKNRGMANQLVNVFSQQGKGRDSVIEGLLRQMSSNERRALEALIAGQVAEQGVRSTAPMFNLR